MYIYISIYMYIYIYILVSLFLIKYKLFFDYRYVLIKVVLETIIYNSCDFLCLTSFN